MELTEEHALLEGAVRDFVATQVAPHAAAWDHEGALPARLWKALAGLGLTGVRAPDSLGGAGMDALALGLVVETVARASGSVAWLLAVHGAIALAAALALEDHETAGQLARGERIGAFAILPDVRAQRTGDLWHLRGRAESVTFDPARGLLVAVAATGEGPTAFRLDPGAVKLHRTATLGLAAAPIGHLDIDGPGQLLGTPGHAMTLIETLQAGANPVFAALSVGLAQGALDTALAYASERRQFGKPIADFQAIQWMIADAATELEAARLLTRKAATGGDRADGLAARILAAEAAVSAADRALQIHGGYGYTRDYPVERFWRDAQRLLVGVDAARAELGKLTCA